MFQKQKNSVHVCSFTAWAKAGEKDMTQSSTPEVSKGRGVKYLEGPSGEVSTRKCCLRKWNVGSSDLTLPLPGALRSWRYLSGTSLGHVCCGGGRIQYIFAHRAAGLWRDRAEHRSTSGFLP